MTNENALMEIEDAEIISAEDMRTNFGLVDRGTVEGIATNMVEHWRGKVTGGYIAVSKSQMKDRANGGVPPEWRKYHDSAGNEIVVRPGTKKEQGDLLASDAVRVTQKTLSRGLNPLAHISIWYQAGQLIDNVNYTIMKGMAEQQGASSFEFADMTPEDIARHKLKPEDIGKIAYLVMDIDKPLLLQAAIAFNAELGFREAKREALEMIAKAKGIGIIRKEENIYVLKGRSLDWLAEKRAGVDAIRRAFGEMTPAQIAHYARGQGFLQQQDLKTVASPDYQAIAALPDEYQHGYLEDARRAEGIKEMSEPDLAQARKQNVASMRDNGDDDPIEGQTEMPDKMVPSTGFWTYANSNGLSREDAGQFIKQTEGDFDAALKLMRGANKQ